MFVVRFSVAGRASRIWRSANWRRRARKCRRRLIQTEVPAPGVMCVSVDAARRRLLPRAGASASVFHEDWGRPCNAQMAERRRHRGGLGFLGRGHLFSSYGDRTFAAAGPRLWNLLPVQLRNPDNSYRRVGTFS